MLFVTAVRLEPTRDTVQHISNVWWLQGDDGTSGTCRTTAFIESEGMDRHGAYVATADGAIGIKIVIPDHGDPYLRTADDESIVDRLLALPRF